jgi:membrane protein
MAPPQRQRPGSGIAARARWLWERWQAGRPGRSLARYSVARGGLLAGGIAYSALFSIFAVLAIAWTVFMSVLGDRAELRETVLRVVDQALPGLIDDGTGNGLVSPDDLVLDTALTPASIVATVVLLWTALSVMSGLRSGIRAMFGIVAPPEPFAISKVRDLGAFVVLALAVALTAVLGLVAGAFSETVLGLLGVDEAAVRRSLRVVGIAVALVVDWGAYVMLLRVSAGVRPPRRDLFLGAALGAVATGALRLLGTSLVGSVDDPVLASFAALATLLLWVNIWARQLLVVAAFTANPPAPLRPATASAVHLDEQPNYVTVSVPRTTRWRHQPVTGTIMPEPEPGPAAGSDNDEDGGDGGAERPSPR